MFVREVAACDFSPETNISRCEKVATRCNNNSSHCLSGSARRPELAEGEDIKLM